ncbi:ATPase subunit of ABC transporter with duplicated ATPase domains [Terracoccus luteus]|jgi:ATP-binding cassette subfamily F protein uup|uniref:ATPase subunit of ABC transporter with duplicated ATPase domains n=1 Tax=Terracoccus luteus TaxID=53356 RepID=A0A495Y0T2_9MICO|nr:ABC-F family ATP-binding cassette domain-containing protein [Terracoccus luteus]RKT78516.1 ATPase subunit of ABC transporter with duplicated ATPase domains [Terracoccus luteus]
MANLVSLERVSLVFGTSHVLDEVSVGVLTGDRIGVVGVNGGGKSTLLRVIAGLQEPDSGRITKQGGDDGIRIGMLSQDDSLDPAATIRETVLGDRPEHVWAGDPRIRDVLTGLLGGIGAEAVGGLDSLVGPKSGGERRRLALARLLVDDPELLLLDEPTNHLDVEGVAWLAEHLATKRPRPGNATVAITHDRWFLDAYATLTWEVESGHVTSFEGGYAAYVLAKAERDRLAGLQAERRANLMRKELAWLRRGPPARTSKPKFRIDAANALIADEPAPRDSVELATFATRRLGKDVLDLEDATVTVGDPPDERVLLDRVTWRLAPGERVGIVGVNGAGKSTLLRALTGDVPLAGGRRRVGKTVAVAYLTQEVRELERFESWRVIEAIEDVKQWTTLGGKEISAGQLATRLGFPGGRQQSRVGDLSGGERRRLQLTRLLLTEPNVLILDEPTNDLDIETLTSLEDVLDGWAGTLIVVSHDRYLLERVCDHQLALLGDGRLRDLPGGVEEYLRLRHAAPARGGSSSSARPAAASAGASGDTETTPAANPAQVREARKVMARVEKQLARLGEREQRLHGDMAENATDPGRLRELGTALQEVVDEREGLELEWLEAAEVVG